ncbi:MAG: AmmeMemoRadiSam system protein B [Micromonosporaceae bacterium]
MSRPAAVAGVFYPADARRLGGLVDAMLAGVAGIADAAVADLAYVVPHAGYRFSGRTAAHVYARLGRAPVRRVVLVGPSHRVPLRGCAVPASAEWSTPLGRVRIDVAGGQALVAAGQARADDRPHASEHSLEVQLPFLQRVLPPEFEVLPVAVGVSTVDEVAGAIATAAGEESSATAVLCSTDLSHYLDDDAARHRDEGTVQAVLALRPNDIGRHDACGVFALRGLVEWARRGQLRPTVLHRCTSADATGDRSRVVGYAAFAFSRPG